MICRLCLQESCDFKSAFDSADNERTIASIIEKYFWFEFQQNDQISTVICNNCWLKVSDFHEFYKSVEEAQSHLGENVVVKIENISVEHSIENVIVQSIPFSSKQEPNDFAEANDEDPFDMPIDRVDNNPSSLLKRKDSNDKLRTQTYGINSMETVENVGDDKDEKSSGHNGRKAAVKKSLKKKKPIKSATTGRTKKNPMPKLQRNVNLCLTKNTRKLGKTENNNSKKEKVKKPIEDPKSIAFDEEIANFMSLHCDRCKLEAKNFNALHSHMLAEHNVKGYARCCNRRFSSRFLLLDHIRRHSNPDSLKCEPCNRIFADRNSLRHHLQIKHQKDEDKMFSCSRCPKKFVKMYLLRQHELVGHSDHKNACLAVDEEIAKFMSLHCEQCNEEATNFTALNRHMRAEHNVRGYVRCCNRKFRERGLLVEHIRAHLNPACYKQVNPFLRKTTNAAEEVRNVINYKDEKFDDDDDGDPFNSEETKIGNKRESTKLSKKEKSVKSARTIRMKHSSPKLPRSANEKGTRKLRKNENNDSRKTKVKKPLEDPKSLAIDEEIAKFMKLQCERCKLEVANFSALQSHMLTEHKIKGYARCCHRRFSSRFLLIDHIRQHSNPDSLKCEPCNRVFADRNSMRNHLLIKHQKDEDKMFSCSRCPKKFVRMYLLRQHELVGHSDHKNACLAVDEEIAKFMPLHCELCSVEVENFTSLKGHMRVEHNMKGYMRCCNRKFFERGLLAEHIRTHLNPACYKQEEDKPFACSQCSNKFVTVYLLQLHKVVAHGDPTNTCKSCSRKFNTAGELTAHIKEQCLCDTCAEVICGVAAFQHHILGHEKSLAGSKDSNVCDICRQDKLCVHNTTRTFDSKVSSFHENFPFPYQYTSTSQENASTTMLTHPNYTHSSGDH
uniref:Transcription factor grauzone n=1 Tax=Glossina palpalis gambiensis TaxID=67801 RepID=A0A1B0B678_9MUSC